MELVVYSRVVLGLRDTMITDSPCSQGLSLGGQIRTQASNHNAKQNALGATVEGSGHPLFYLSTVHALPASVLLFLRGHHSSLLVRRGADSASMPGPSEQRLFLCPKWLAWEWVHDSNRTNAFCAVTEKRNSLSCSGVTGQACNPGTLGCHLATVRGACPRMRPHEREQRWERRKWGLDGIIVNLLNTSHLKPCRKHSSHQFIHSFTHWLTVLALLPLIPVTCVGVCTIIRSVEMTLLLINGRVGIELRSVSKSYVISLYDFPRHRC